MAVTQRHRQTPCRLLTLPAEIRIRIYDYVLYVPTADGKLTLVKRRQRVSDNEPYSVLAILQTCRQIRNEAEAVFYHINHLRFKDLSQIFAPKSRTCYLGLPRRAAIRTLTVGIGNCFFNGPIVGGIEWFSSLEVLQLELRPRVTHNLRMFWNCHGTGRLPSTLAKLEMLKEIRLIAPINSGMDEKCEEIGARLMEAVERQRGTSNKA